MKRVSNKLIAEGGGHIEDLFTLASELFKPKETPKEAKSYSSVITTLFAPGEDPNLR